MQLLTSANPVRHQTQRSDRDQCAATTVAAELTTVSVLSHSLFFHPPVSAEIWPLVTGLHTTIGNFKIGEHVPSRGCWEVSLFSRFAREPGTNAWTFRCAQVFREDAENRTRGTRSPFHFGIRVQIFVIKPPPQKIGRSMDRPEEFEKAELNHQISDSAPVERAFVLPAIVWL